MKTFEVEVGDKLLDVPGRVLETPSILYDQVGVESRSFFSNLYNCDKLSNLLKQIKNAVDLVWNLLSFVIFFFIKTIASCIRLKHVRIRLIQFFLKF